MGVFGVSGFVLFDLPTIFTVLRLMTPMSLLSNWAVPSKYIYNFFCFKRHQRRRCWTVTTDNIDVLVCRKISQNAIVNNNALECDLTVLAVITAHAVHILQVQCGECPNCALPVSK